MKYVLLGLSGVGKTTIVERLRDEINLPILEVDDILFNLKVLNKREDLKNSDIFEMTEREVLEMENAFYVTSKMLPEGIKEFYERGFKIIELHADYRTIIERLEKRENLSNDEKEAQKYKVKIYMERINDKNIQNCFTLKLDTSNLNEDQVYLIVKNLINIY